MFFTLYIIALHGGTRQTLTWYKKKKELRMVKGTGPTGHWQLWSHTRQAAAAERYTPVCA
jgi:hypothetical protein